MTYAAPRGHALIDRALYVPKSWSQDPDRCMNAEIRNDKRGFATKPALAVTRTAA
jgi:SRSO17 transposase